MPRILVIDDDKHVRYLLRVVLERQGYSVVEAENGNEGLQCYRAEPTDLVITDMQMPVMDGLQMIRELRRVFPAAKVIAMSGGRGVLNLVQTLVQRTFDKPFCIEELLDTVQQLASAPDFPGLRAAEETSHTLR